MKDNTVVAIMVIGYVILMCVIAFSDQDSAFGKETLFERKARYKHEKEMLILQRDTMPKDSIITIQGVEYKLSTHKNK